MQVQSWVIASWPIIERPCDPAFELSAELKHLGTTVSGDCDEFGRLLGHTIWGAADQQFGLAWDWTEAHDGVFALSDPMGVVSNIAFVDEGGVNLSERLSAVHLNRIAHQLPWQAEVARATNELRSSNPWSRRAESVWDALHTAKEEAPNGLAAPRTGAPSWRRGRSRRADHDAAPRERAAV